MSASLLTRIAADIVAFSVFPFLTYTDGMSLLRVDVTTHKALAERKAMKCIHHTLSKLYKLDEKMMRYLREQCVQNLSLTDDGATPLTTLCSLRKLHYTLDVTRHTSDRLTMTIASSLFPPQIEVLKFTEEQKFVGATFYLDLDLFPKLKILDASAYLQRMHVNISATHIPTQLSSIKIYAKSLVMSRAAAELVLACPTLTSLTLKVVDSSFSQTLDGLAAPALQHLRVNNYGSKFQMYMPSMRHIDSNSFDGYNIINPSMLPNLTSLNAGSGDLSIFTTMATLVHMVCVYNKPINQLPPNLKSLVIVFDGPHSVIATVDTQFARNITSC
jgi:hypothetical protein